RDAAPGARVSASAAASSPRAGNAHPSLPAWRAPRGRRGCRGSCRQRILSWRFSSAGSGELGQHGGPAVVDGVAHGLSGSLAHALEIAMLEIDAGAIRAFGREAHLDLRREGDARIGLPLAIDLPAHHESFAGLPGAEVTDHDLAAVGVLRVPAAADARLDDGFEHR